MCAIVNWKRWPECGGNLIALYKGCWEFQLLDFSSSSVVVFHSFFYYILLYVYTTSRKISEPDRFQPYVVANWTLDLRLDRRRSAFLLADGPLSRSAINRRWGLGLEI